MDLATLLVSTLVVVLTASLGLGIVFATSRTYAGFGWWFAGSLARSLSVALFLLPRDRLPALLTIILPNFLLVLESMLELQGVAVFRDRFRGLLWMVPVGLSALLLMAYFTSFEPSMSYRLVVRSLFTGALYLWTAHLLLDRRPPYFGSADLVMVGVLMCGVLFSFSTGLQAWTLPSRMPEAKVVETILSLRYGTILVMMTAMLATLSQLMMNTQRLAHDQKLVEERLELDIAARREAERRLQASEELHRVLAENARDVVWRMQLDGTITYISPSVEAVRGFTPEEAMKQSPYEIHTQESLAQTIEYMKRLYACMEAGRPLENFRGDLEYRCKDGSTFWTEVLAYPVTRPDGGVELMGVTRDLSQRKLAEARKAELEVAHRRLQKSESLSRMAGAIAHHVNNQLMVVTGYLDLAMVKDVECPVDREELKRLLARSLKAAQDAAGVGEMMLTYLGHLHPNHETFDLARLCSTWLAELRDTLPPESKLEVALPVPGPLVHADPGHVQRIVANLVANACEATDGHPNHIRVTVGSCPAAAIPAGVRFPVDFHVDREAYACLAVADSGSGIAGDQMEKLFDPFYSTKLTGRGIGLPTVLGIVRAHDGVITVESREGEGSAFRVFLPLVSSELTA